MLNRIGNQWQGTKGQKPREGCQLPYLSRDTLVPEPKD